MQEEPIINKTYIANICIMKLNIFVMNISKVKICEVNVEEMKLFTDCLLKDLCLSFARQN